jgi:glucose/arabinose dehydrogenase
LISEYGRLREVIQAKDGSIYLTTSNRDGRGNLAAGDDKIIRLIPK